MSIKRAVADAEPLGVILLDEAIERFNKAVKPYGIGVSPWRRNAKARRLVAEIESAIAPLELPNELRSFWLRHDPTSIVRPALDGFIALPDALERRMIDCPPAPLVLFPLADWTHSRVWIELASDDHPGGRIFHSYHDESEASLWAFGLSELFDLLSLAFERDMIDDRVGGLHAGNFEALVRRHLIDAMGAEAPRRFEAVDRSRFPPHWQTAEGITRGHFALLGPSHSVVELQAERDKARSVKATLSGRFDLDVGGGPLRGCIGTFHDPSGSMQIFVPESVAIVGSVGREGLVEMDVVAVRPNGQQVGSLSAKRDLEHAAASGLNTDDRELFLRLMQQMRDLDTSVVAVALRPIW